jgi:hypothetical protein
MALAMFKLQLPHGHPASYQKQTFPQRNAAYSYSGHPQSMQKITHRKSRQKTGTDSLKEKEVTSLRPSTVPLVRWPRD